jgi:hypothetical protein
MRKSSSATPMLSRRRVIEIHHVGNHAAGQPRAAAELAGRLRVDHHVLDGRQPRRKRRQQIVVHRVDQIPLPLPDEVVVMGDAADARLHHQLHHCQAQGNVHGNRQAVFGDDQVQLKTRHRRMELLLDHPGHLVDFGAGLRRAALAAEALPADLLDRGVLEMGLADHLRALRRPVRLAGDEEALVPHALEHVGPLLNLQADAVVTRYPRGDETDAIRVAAGLLAHRERP